LAPGEECDDSNAIEDDVCTTACLLSPELPTLELTLSQVKRFDFHWESRGAEWYELYERTNEGEELVQIGGMLSEESYSMAVPLLYRTHASYMLRACNTMRCVDSVEIAVPETVAEAIGYFKASNTFHSSNFGYSVAMSEDGNTMAIGSPGESSNSKGIDGEQNKHVAAKAGAVYVFARKEDTWVQEEYIKASNTDAGDEFGFSVALSADGHTLAVGAPGEDSGAMGFNDDDDDDDDTFENAGAVYVFKRTDTWDQDVYIKPSNTGIGDLFGWSVAISGDGHTLAVGAPFERSGAKIINGDQGDTAPAAGATYVFTRAGEEWSQEAYVKPHNADEYDRFGYSVALSGDSHTLAVGAPFEQSLTTGINEDEGENIQSGYGAAYVFTRTGDTWTQEAYVKPQFNDGSAHFGWILALPENGNTLVVGAPDGLNVGGRVHMFRRENTWSPLVYFEAINHDPGDHFGTSLALSNDGKSLAVSSPNEQSQAVGLNGDWQDDSNIDAGAAYLYITDDENWLAHAYIKPSLSSVRLNFGSGIALSSDGRVLAIGASDESGGSSGIGGDAADDSRQKSGAVYVY